MSIALQYLSSLGDTLAPSVAPEAAAAMAHPPDEQFVDPTDWETEFFSESVRTTQDLLLLWDTPVPTSRDTRTLFSTLVKDLVSLTLVVEKRGALEALFLLPRLILPTTT